MTDHPGQPSPEEEMGSPESEEKADGRKSTGPEKDWQSEKSAKKPEHRVCDECGRWIDRGEILYRMRIELFAEESVDLNKEDVGGIQQTDSLEELIHLLESMTDEEAAEATDQVYETHEFALCSGCRKSVHLKLKHRNSIIGE